MTSSSKKENNESTQLNNIMHIKVSRLLMEKHPKLTQKVQVKLTHIDKTLIWRRYFKCNRINSKYFGFSTYPVESYRRRKLTRKSKNESVETIRRVSGRKKKLSNTITTINISDSSETESAPSETDEVIGRWERSKDNKYKLSLFRVYSCRDGVVKKVELADIDEVRRMNKTILTAQVSPISVRSQQKDKTKDTTSKIERNTSSTKKINEKATVINRQDEMPVIDLTLYPEAEYKNIDKQPNINQAMVTPKNIAPLTNTNYKIINGDNNSFGKRGHKTVPLLNDISIQRNIVKNLDITSKKSSLTNKSSKAKQKLIKSQRQKKAKALNRKVQLIESKFAKQFDINQAMVDEIIFEQYQAKRKRKRKQHMKTVQDIVITQPDNQQTKATETITPKKPITGNIDEKLEDLDDLLQCTIIKKPSTLAGMYSLPETDVQTQPYLVTADDALVVKDTGLTPIITGVCSLAAPGTKGNKITRANVHPTTNTISRNGPHLFLNSYTDSYTGTIISPIQHRGEPFPINMVSSESITANSLNNEYNDGSLYILPTTDTPTSDTITPTLTQTTAPTIPPTPTLAIPLSVMSFTAPHTPSMVSLMQMQNSLTSTNVNSSPILCNALISTSTNVNSSPILCNALTSTSTPLSLGITPIQCNITQPNKKLMYGIEVQSAAEGPSELRSVLGSSCISSDDCANQLRSTSKIIRLDSSKPLWAPGDHFLVLTEKLLHCSQPTYWFSKPFAQIIWPKKCNTRKKKNTYQKKDKEIKIEIIESNQSENNPNSLKVKSFAKIADMNRELKYESSADILQVLDRHFKKLSDDPLRYGLLLSAVTSTEECDSLLREEANLCVLNLKTYGMEPLLVTEAPQGDAGGDRADALLVRHTDIDFITGMARKFQELNAANALVRHNQVYVYALTVKYV
ncbi:uncharacterized protein [Epargyreus clarus]|uniref:uncharacterized protein isoform X2 n=1 Tax=Epargyreus clarus TaxID=520877 RepID=UPI003C2DEC7F